MGKKRDMGRAAVPRRLSEVGGWDVEADVVVVGFGGAGACAALEARAEGADVLLPCVEAAVPLGHQRCGVGLLFGRVAKRRRGQGGGAKRSGLHKTPPIHRRQAVRAFVEDFNFHGFFNSDSA